MGKSEQKQKYQHVVHFFFTHITRYHDEINSQRRQSHVYQLTGQKFWDGFHGFFHTRKLISTLFLPHKSRIARRSLLLLQQSSIIALDLVRPADRDILWSKVTKRSFEQRLYDPAACIINDHDDGQRDFEIHGKGYEFQLLVDFRDEFCGAGKRDRGDEDDAVVHASVLLDRFSERTALVVDCERRDLLDQLQEVDGRVEQRRLELAFEVDFGLFRLGPLDVLRDVDQRRDVDCELPEDGADDVRVKNVGLRPLFR